MDDPISTYQRLFKEQEEWERNGGLSRTGPLFIFEAKVSLDSLEKAFERGDPFALMLALRKCANHDLVMPAWVARAYIQRFDLVLNYHAGSWDEVFENPLKKGQHLSALRQRREMKFAVFNKVTEIRRRDRKTPIDRPLFERIAEELKMELGLKNFGGSLCERYYYDVLKQMNDIGGKATF